jgi:SecY interacting protein Syd
LLELDRLLENYVEHYRTTFGTAPRQIHDPQWPSPCERGTADAHGFIEWLPVRRTTAPDFSGLESALECTLHPSLTAYFGRYYSDIVTGRTSEGGVSLVQMWNDADYDRFVDNMLGHAMAKQRANQPLTLFFATTDEDEYFLSVDNTSGKVMLESPGQGPIREVALDLATFVARVEPLALAPGEEQPIDR